MRAAIASIAGRADNEGPMGEGPRALAPDEVAEIYRRHGPKLLRRCRAVLRDPALADDALQEVFVRLLRHGAGYREAEAKLSWLCRVADRCCFDLAARRGATVNPETIPEPTAVRPTGPAELQAQARSVLDRLRLSEQAVTVLAFVEEASQGEIARQLGRCRQSVNEKLKRLRARFRRWAHLDRAPPAT